MKIIVNILIFVFFAVLVTPTVISLLQDDTDISISCNLEEEEVQKELAEYKMSPAEFSFTFYPPVKKKTLFISYNLREHTRVCGDIFLPPPEQI